MESTSRLSLQPLAFFSLTAVATHQLAKLVPKKPNLQSSEERGRGASILVMGRSRWPRAESRIVLSRHVGRKRPKRGSMDKTNRNTCEDFEHVRPRSANDANVVGAVNLLMAGQAAPNASGGRRLGLAYETGNLRGI